MPGIELYIAATAGALLHFLFKYNNSRKRAAAVFNWKRQVITTLTGLLSVFLLIYVREDISLFNINHLTAAFLGYLGDSALKNLFKQFKKKLENFD